MATQESLVHAAERLRDRLLVRLGKDRYQLWFHKNTTIAWGEDGVTVGVPNHFFKDWLEKSFLETVRDAAADVLGRPLPVKFVIDPFLFQATQKPQSKAQPGAVAEAAPRPPKLLVDTAPLLVYRRDGRNHLLKSLPKKGALLSRSLGKLLRFVLHYGADGRDWPCFGKNCETCDSRGPDSKRHEVGYYDSIRAEIHERVEECHRVVQGLPAGVVARLDLGEGDEMRGFLWEFRRVPFEETRIKRVQTTCDYQLDEPIDCRLVIARRYGLLEWPNQARELGDLLRRKKKP